jgi:hypothetical protein
MWPAVSTCEREFAVTILASGNEIAVLILGRPTDCEVMRFVYGVRLDFAVPVSPQDRTASLVDG